MATGYSTDDFSYQSATSYTELDEEEHSVSGSSNNTGDRKDRSDNTKHMSSNVTADGSMEKTIKESDKYEKESNHSAESDARSDLSDGLKSYAGDHTDESILIDPFKTMKLAGIDESSQDSTELVRVRSKSSKTGSSSSKRKSIRKSILRDKLLNPIDLIKRITNRKDEEKKKKEDEKAERERYFKEVLASIRIDKLPQVFVAKYLGKENVEGLSGLRHTKKPVENMVEKVSKLKKDEDLPLVALRVGRKGMSIISHKQNKVPGFQGWWLPIEYISYGIQDPQFPRIFAMITVQEMSSQTRQMECHAFVCNSAVTARKLALSMALGFKVYAKSLGGQPHKFMVDLRSPEQITASEHDDEAEA